MTSFLGVPIRSGDQILGDLYLTDKQHAPEFSDTDEELAEMLARHAALAITNAGLVNKLAASERRYRTLAEGAPDIVFALDGDFRVTFVNERWQAVTGGRAHVIIGTPFDRLFAVADQSLVELHLRAMNAGNHRASFTATVDHSDGGRARLDIIVVASDGNGTSYQGVARDVSAQHALARDMAERTSELLTSREERRRLRDFVAMIIQAQEDERSRIAGDLHDTTVQTLTAIGRRLRSLADNATEPAAMELAELADAALSEAEEVRRLSRNLRPSALDHLGLPAALASLVHEVEQTGLNAKLQVVGDAGNMDDRQRTALFRIAQEALTNVRRHSNATTVHLRLTVNADALHLVINDDGTGFDAANTPPGRGLGLAGMRERAAMLGGAIEIDSALGAGTTVMARLPLDG